MTKSDLKTGMVIKTREGKFGIVMLNTSNGDIIGGMGSFNGSESTWFPLSGHKEDLTAVYNHKDHDIVSVYSYNNNQMAGSTELTGRKLLWEREDNVVQLTEAYEAIINKLKGHVVVGCQIIPFEKVEELYNKIKNN